jgi:two-component system response regulator
MKGILLVEDNASDEKLTVLAFRHCDVANELVVVRDGAEALDYLFGTGAYTGRAPKVLPALILLDLKLPRISGLDVLGRIRADPRAKLVPIVILSSSKEDGDIGRGYALGANAFVHKPVDFVEFAAAVKALGLFWLRFNESPARGGTS